MSQNKLISYEVITTAEAAKYVTHDQAGCQRRSFIYKDKAVAVRTVTT